MKIICEDMKEVQIMQEILSNKCPFGDKHCEPYEGNCAYCKVEQVDYEVDGIVVA